MIDSIQDSLESRFTTRLTDKTHSLSLYELEAYASQTMALVGVELERLVSETDALTTRPTRVSL